MKNKITFLCLILTFTTLFAQNEEKDERLESIKEFFQYESTLSEKELYELDYAPQAAMLERLIKTEPENAEAHYLLGYLYSRMNSRDGRSLIRTQRGLTEKTSEQFEKVNQLSPCFHRVLFLDPYSKLTSEWGALAMRYSYYRQSDSAVWAYKEGKRRGGFGEFYLQFNRNVLKQLSPHAILLTSGDNSTFPLWYLQTVENLRTDVIVIDVVLLRTDWYPALLNRLFPTLFDLPPSVLDTIQFTAWSDSEITIGDFKWIVKPSIYNHYLSRSDLLLLSLLRSNNFKRDVYFTLGFLPDSRVSLEPHLSSLQWVDQLNPQGKVNRSDKQYLKTAANLLDLSHYVNTNSIDEIRFYDSFRVDLAYRASLFMQANELKKAKELTRLILRKGNSQKVPYYNEYVLQFIDYFQSR